MTAILGISAFYHDSAAALVVDGRIVAAAQQERFSRKKHDDSFPVDAIESCLEIGGISPEELDFVGFYDKPLLKFDRLLETYLAVAPAGFRSFSRAMPVWLKLKLHLPRLMRAALGGAYRRGFIFTEHHESHAASAFFPSPFEKAAILTLDGVGEWATATFGTGRGNRIDLTHEIRFPHSLGLLYSAFTAYCGFRVNDGEYKLMGLAPYGEPEYVELIQERLLDLREDGSFLLDMKYFDYCRGLTMTSAKFHDLFGGPPRGPYEPLTRRHMNLAASVQQVTEEIMLTMATHVQRVTGMEDLCLAGGVALNCVGNGRILRDGPFRRLWIQPAAGDAGGALGVALFIWHQLLGNERQPAADDQQQRSLLGEAFGDDEIRGLLDREGVSYERPANEAALLDRAAHAVAAGRVVAWFQGRMEFGPRALGSRSILGDARRPEMVSLINRKVKFREGFRPFAPIVLAEHAHQYFELGGAPDSPYMLLVVPVEESMRRPPSGEPTDGEGLERLRQVRSVIPAVTHVDHSARVQTVDPGHGRLHRLMEAFLRKTGCPVMINTSFNLGWEPIVRSPQDAYRTFMSSEMDLLVMGDYLVSKPALAAAEEDPWGDRLRSPCCARRLAPAEGSLTCRGCGHEFPITDGIPQLFWPHDRFGDPGDVTRIVKEFYEATPFPNYDEHDSSRSLIEKSRAGRYARLLDQSIPYQSWVLDAGCGTGQLANFLGIANRRVIGADVCLNSLRLGEEFRQAQGLERVRFAQMNLFRPPFARQAFDVVLCNGVLHHTADPLSGFRTLAPLVRPGGYFVLGLYNTFGRLLTDLRRQVFRVTGGRARWVDPILRRSTGSDGKQEAWFSDQYRHPHESKHSFGEVLGWLEQVGLQFVRGVPAFRLDDEPLDSDLFAPRSPGSALERFLSQVAHAVSGQREGGFFIVIAQRPADAAARPGASSARRAEAGAAPVERGGSIVA